MKTQIQKSITSILIAGLLLTGCLPQKDDEASTTPGEGADLIPTAMFGSKRRCALHGASAGTSLNGKAYTMYFTFNTDGTYSYSNWYSTETSCNVAGYAAPGGEDLFRFNQAGTWSVAGVNTDGSVKVVFKPTAQSLTPRTGTQGVLMKDAVNTNCGLALSGGFNLNVDNTYCGATNSAFIVPTIPALGSSIYQTFTIDNGAFKSGPAEDTFLFGHYSTHPSTYTTPWVSY